MPRAVVAAVKANAGKSMSMILKAESSEMVRPLEEKPWKALGFALTILNCVANTVITQGLSFVVIYKIKGFMNLGTFVLNFFQYFLCSCFGNRIFNLRPLLFP